MEIELLSFTVRRSDSEGERSPSGACPPWTSPETSSKWAVWDSRSSNNKPLFVNLPFPCQRDLVLPVPRKPGLKPLKSFSDVA
ncbi:hypothetical protein AAFF_G00351620 [Aldrovandia affinis]|uniref:Uncharacterized protein n=1 Tax=Aldrovandia affinis TaxID=143900 RepID=A0AAD7SJ96_9TELE|nr:hypothetical protein AAFF_G00351620 [Aldrovandia affinis]